MKLNECFSVQRVQGGASVLLRGRVHAQLSLTTGSVFLKEPRWTRLQTGTTPRSEAENASAASIVFPVGSEQRGPIGTC